MNGSVESRVTVQEVKRTFYTQKRRFFLSKLEVNVLKNSVIEVADSSFFQEGRWRELDYENADSCSKVTVVGITA
jgi:hypothetical protein